MIFDWPDAMANFAFIESFIADNQFLIPFPDNSDIQNVVHPRSVNVFAGNLVPMGFIGQVLLYGLIGKVIGVYGVLFLTPFFGSLAVYYYYRLCAKIFHNDLVGFISAALLATQSAFVYYTMVVMLHTVLFVSLLIIGFWLLIKRNDTDKAVKKYTLIFFSGFTIGFALAVRTVEAPWVLLSVLILSLIYARQKWWLSALIFCFGLSAAFAPVFLINSQLYGDALSFGYLKLHQSGEVFSRLPDAFKVSGQNQFERVIRAVFLPFGWNVKNLFKVGYFFILQNFWPYLSLTVLGLVAFLRQKEKSLAMWVYLGIGSMICLWLVLYYGNWRFDDLDVLRYASISSSYTRYLLPFYILTIPGAAYFIYRLISGSKAKFLRQLAAIFIILGVVGFSGYSALFGQKADGLIHYDETTRRYYRQFMVADAILPANSLVITDRADKYFFPKYQTVVFQLNYSIFPELARVIDKYPIYYFTVMPDKDISYINREKINEFNLILHQPITIDDSYRLFRLDTLENFTKNQK